MPSLIAPTRAIFLASLILAIIAWASYFASTPYIGEHPSCSRRTGSDARVSIRFMCASTARCARPSAPSQTARIITSPCAIPVENDSTPIENSTFSNRLRIAAPIIEPLSPPRPPLNEVPPTAIAAKTVARYGFPEFGSPDAINAVSA